MIEYPVAKAYADARIQTVYGGTTEVMKEIIGRSLGLRGAVVRDAVIVEAVRTPVGKRGGGLSGVHPADLSTHVLTALVARTGLDPAVVDDVVWGCVGQVGEQTFDVARTAVLSAGWPESVPGVTVDRQCGSSQQSVHFAAAGLIAGQYNVVVAGGVESMSRVPMGRPSRTGRGAPSTGPVGSSGTGSSRTRASAPR
jgi:acetyl-CoA acyltransferase